MSRQKKKKLLSADLKMTTEGVKVQCPCGVLILYTEDKMRCPNCARHLSVRCVASITT